MFYFFATAKRHAAQSTHLRSHWDGHKTLSNASAMVEPGQNARGRLKSELLWFGILGEGQQLISLVTTKGSENTARYDTRFSFKFLLCLIQGDQEWKSSILPNSLNFGSPTA